MNEAINPHVRVDFCEEFNISVPEYTFLIRVIADKFRNVEDHAFSVGLPVGFPSKRFFDPRSSGYNRRLATAMLALMEQDLADSEQTRKRMLMELCYAAFSNYADLIDENNAVCPAAVRKHGRMIKKIKQSRLVGIPDHEKERLGLPLGVSHRVDELILHDKIAAIKLLAFILGVVPTPNISVNHPKSQSDECKALALDFLAPLVGLDPFAGDD